jgi:hypothetical protein
MTWAPAVACSLVFTIRLAEVSSRWVIRTEPSTTWTVVVSVRSFFSIWLTEKRVPTGTMLTNLVSTETSLSGPSLMKTRPLYRSRWIF